MGGLYGKLFKKREARILLQGLDAAGKTTVLYRLKLGEVVSTIPTIGFNVETIKYKNIDLIAWDVGGGDKIRPLLRHYYQNTEALIYIVDCDDQEACRIQEVKDEIHNAMKEDELRSAFLLVLANKQDLPSAWSPSKLSEVLELYKLPPSRTWNIFPTCAKTGDGLFEAFDWLITQFGAKDPHPDSTSPPVNASSTSSPDNGPDSFPPVEKPLDLKPGHSLYTRMWTRLTTLFRPQKAELPAQDRN